MSDTYSRDREHWNCPGCGSVMYPQGAAPGVYWCEECQREYWREGDDWWRCDESGEPERVEMVTDGGGDKSGEERTLNPETHIDPEDYLSLVYEAEAAIHFYLKDDKEWWVAHGPADQPDGEFDGPWLFWTTYPSGPWGLDYLTEEFARFHLGELYYGPVGELKHSIHRARLVPMADAPRFVQEVVGWNSRGLDTGRERSGGGA